MHELRNVALKVEMELAEPEARGMKRVRQETFSTGGSYSSRFQRRTFQPTRSGQSHSSAPVRPSYSTASTSPRLPSLRVGGASTTSPAQSARGGYHGARGGHFGGRRGQGPWSRGLSGKRSWYQPDWSRQWSD
ncbi:hypothetical protein LIER_39760 [Lithospermum erythrorhizon]|uniref:Uncharacterized protein n=1 Tax=Lithospermum erythrorhizon TaxID=34254 RepID=A0AAV3QKV6_LITER